jgi:hypothetical protein
MKLLNISETSQENQKYSIVSPSIDIQTLDILNSLESAQNSIVKVVNCYEFEQDDKILLFLEYEEIPSGYISLS